MSVGKGNLGTKESRTKWVEMAEKIKALGGKLMELILGIEVYSSVFTVPFETANKGLASHRYNMKIQRCGTSVSMFVFDHRREGEKYIFPHHNFYQIPPPGTKLKGIPPNFSPQNITIYILLF